MTAAADYSFNRSHAACYALIAYRTAYLKANYAAEYMAALISSVMSTKDKVPFFVNRCEEMGIEVLPPDANTSEHGFVVSGSSIRFGLDAVKNVGHAAVQAIIATRAQDGPFRSIWDFCERVDARAVNKRAIECLVKCGALDSTGASRQGMLTVLQQAQANGQKAQEDAQRGQGSIFDLGGPPEAEGPSAQVAAITAPGDPPVPAGEFEQRELLAMEKETLGTYVTSHPLSGIREALRERVDCSLAELRAKEDRSMLTIGGLIGERRKLRTRSGADMMFASLDDLEGTVELLAFNQVLERCGGILEPDRVVVVKGRLDHREGGKTSFVVQEAEQFEPDAATVVAARTRATAPAEPFTLALAPADFEPTLIEELKGIFSAYPGESEVMLDMPTSGGMRRLRFGRDYRVNPSAALRADVDSLLSSRALAA
jgi:DNA polymerase III subunit alpha